MFFDGQVQVDLIFGLGNVYVFGCSCALQFFSGFET